MRGMPPRSVLRHRWALVLPVLLALAGPAGAGERVRVTVVTILASQRDREVEPRLRCIAREVRKLYPRLTGFRMSRMCCKSLPVGARDDFDLVAGQVASVTVQKGADKEDRVRLKVAPPLLGEITYDTACGKFLPIVTPFRTADGDRLLIAVRVQPCHGK